MNYETVSAEEFTTITLRHEEDIFFRPAATGTNIELLKTKVKMEVLESESAGLVPGGYISSAAHEDKQTAIIHSEMEAAERISCAIWWALNQPFLCSADSLLLKQLKREYIRDQKIAVAGGYIRNLLGSGFVSVAILHDNFNRMAVLGSASGQTPELALEKSLLESIQSWVGTKWLREQKTRTPIYWDIENLLRRAEELTSDCEQLTTPQFERVITEPLRTVAIDYNGSHVAFSYGPSSHTGLTPDLVEMYVPDTPVLIYTQCNQ